MRTRDKIALLLFSVTLGLGAVIFWQTSGSDMELRRFRWLVARSPLGFLTEEIFTPANSTGLWYGGIALAAIVMVLLILKSVNSAELRAFRDRLVEMEVAKSELETLLHDAVWKEKHARDGREAAIKDLEAALDRFYALEGQLSEAERLLKMRERELKTLRSPGAAQAAQPGAPASAKTEREEALRQELEQTTELLREKESAIKELENNLSATVQTQESRREEKEQLLRQREKELAALRGRLSEIDAAQGRAESSLRQELDAERQARRAQESAMKQREQQLSGKIEALESQRREQEDLLRSRSAELEQLRAEAKALSGRLADADSVKGKLQANTEQLRSQESARREAEKNLTAKLQMLENQLEGKTVLLKQRDAELDVLRGQQTKVASTQGAVEQSLRGDLKKSVAVLAAQENAIRGLEQKLAATVRERQEQDTRQEALLKQRAADIERLQSELAALQSRPAEKGALPEWVQQAAAPSGKELAERLKEVRTLGSQLAETTDQLKIRDQKIERLEAELKEKRTELARHEIGVWQSVERRSQWKRRLSKFGISMKD